MKVKIVEIRKTLEGILKDKGISPKDATILADEYLEGELRGKHSHGLAAFPSIIEKLSKTRRKPEIIKETHRDPNLRVSCIGQAGENLVRFAAIINDYDRAAARSGSVWHARRRRFVRGQLLAGAPLGAAGSPIRAPLPSRLGPSRQRQGRCDHNCQTDRPGGRRADQ